MPGLYSITTRAAGTVLTATIYNADHQNHVDHQTPDSTDDWSVSVSQMRLTSDPYPSQGSESQATSLDGELTRLRYAIGQLSGWLNGRPGIAAASTALGSALGQWYFGVRNPALKVAGAHVAKAAAFSHTTSGVSQAVTFDTEYYDADGAGTGFHSTVSNTSRLTIPANFGSGSKYRIYGFASFPASAVGTLRELLVRLNGVDIIGGTTTSWAITADRAVRQSVNFTYPLDAGNYIELMANQDTGGSLGLNGPANNAGPEFSIQLVGY